MAIMKVIFYETIDGSCPAIEFIKSLPPKMYARVLHTIKLLEDNGSKLREPYSKCLGNGIFELRTSQGNNIVRVLYFFCVGDFAIITNGFIKKTQKTPVKEIAIACNYKNDYERRY